MEKKNCSEEAKAEHPFQFISGLGTTLEDFENQITSLAKGDKFDFTIPADKAYGQYDEQHVIDLPKHIFKLTVNSIANTSKKVTSYLCRLAMASV